ncbi:ABC transporter ATP-binding protein [Gammaproteobacteria bacterium]|nr:ABC transporter ATP-binding protein [Gammaproteobacteria bacterium]
MKTAEITDSVLSVQNLSTEFSTSDGAVYAVNDVSFSLKPGELLGVVGESGSGKSVTMMSLLKLLPTPPARISQGRVEFNGHNLLELPADQLRQVRGGQIGFVFQDPMTSLNPVFTIGEQLMEPLKVHRGMNRAAARARAIELLQLVNIPAAETRLKSFPHQLSGGMRQRVMIALALSCDPKVLIADEATTALDVTVQAQILELIKELRNKLGMAIVWITHDLGVVAGIADHIMVMYGGQVVEYAPTRALFKSPAHPYTAALLSTLPRMNAGHQQRLKSIAGQPPNLKVPPASCPFAERCSERHARCDTENPGLQTIDGEHRVGCWLNDGRGLQ